MDKKTIIVAVTALVVGAALGYAIETRFTFKMPAKVLGEAKKETTVNK